MGHSCWTAERVPSWCQFTGRETKRDPDPGLTPGPSFGADPNPGQDPGHTLAAPAPDPGLHPDLEPGSGTHLTT